MRKITAGPILFFIFLSIISGTFSIFTVKHTIDSLALGDFRGIILTFGAILLFYLYSIFLYRIFLYFRPVHEGPIPKDSIYEFENNLYVLYFLLLFRSLIGTKIIPVPINRIIYQLLGAKLGKNTYCAGIILDPPLTVIGANSIIGHDATLYSHAIEGDHLSNKKIILGDNITIGAHCIIMSGVLIGNNSIVAAGSVVIKDTQIGENEVWSGIPAKFFKKITYP